MSINDKQIPNLKRPVSSDPDVWIAYWRTVGQGWRTEPEIDIERQKYLSKRLGIISNVEQRVFPFKDVKLCRADIEWFLAAHLDTYGAIHYVIGSPAQGIDVRGADLRYTNLSRLPLTQLRGGLRSAEWFSSTREQRDAAAVHLEGANLNRSDLTWATLRSAHLEGADLRYAHLEGAHLRSAHLEGDSVSLSAADLRNASFNQDTNLDGAILGNKKSVFVRLADINWGGINLALVEWAAIEMVGDEYEAHKMKTKDGQVKGKQRRLDEYKVAVRTNRQLAVVLQAQGLNEEAAYFAYRAHKLQRRTLLFQGKRFFGRYLFSAFLDLLAGYGYRPGRTLLWYLIVVFGFSIAYYSIESALKPRLTLIGALIFSITAFHGRGFFPGGFSYDDIVTVLASIEAVVGLLIELSFIATFTQRFFGN